MFKKIYFIIVFIFNICYAQKPYPADVQTESYLFINAKVHVGNGQLIESASLGFKDGKINLVGSSTDVDQSKYENVINVKGKHIYPGFIVLNSILGLSEIGAVRATRDYSDAGKYNPNVRSLIAYNTDSKVIPTVRTNGVLIAQVIPTGGRISGSSSVFNLDGWNWEDAVLMADDGVHLFWPSYYSRDRRTRKIEESKKYSDEINELRAFFKNAKAYNKKGAVKKVNLRYQSLQKVFSGERSLYIHADDLKEIKHSILFAKEFSIEMIVLVGGHESYKCIDFLKEHKIPVVLNGIHSLPALTDEDYDMPYKLPDILSSNGILVSLGRWGATAARNIPFEAGTAAAFGLSQEDAVKLITLNAAKVLGIDDQVGSLEVGKKATLFISEGDALDMKTSKVVYAFIDGKKIDLRNEQTELYERYVKKYNTETR